MKSPARNYLFKYLVIKESDTRWGITSTTSGYQAVKSRDTDPIMNMHPNSYKFKTEQGRVLDEYQIVYIVEGRGTFKSASVPQTLIPAGTMFLLFPGEWHTYYPDPLTGWKEYWIGFKGPVMDNRVNSGYFSRQSPFCDIGINETVLNLYNEIISIAVKDKIGSQQIISSIALTIMGYFYYKKLNSIESSQTRIIDILNRARCQMRENLRENLSLEKMAMDLGIGYSWFRRMFKKYEGISPAQYLIQLKISKIKELLTTSYLSLTEIAFEVGIENKSQLSTFFKKYEQITPSEFRHRYQFKYFPNEE